MTREQVKEILDRVMTWPQEDQERVVRFVQQLEGGFSTDDITDEEWKITEERAARRDIASDEEIKTLFERHRGA